MTSVKVELESCVFRENPLFDLTIHQRLTHVHTNPVPSFLLMLVVCVCVSAGGIQYVN